MSTAPEEMFESASRSRGDLAGVLEYDGQTVYFYLYRLGDRGSAVLDAIHVCSGHPDFSASDVEIRWNPGEEVVALFIRGQMWAAFNTRKNEKYGGNYQLNIKDPALEALVDEFRPI